MYKKEELLIFLKELLLGFDPKTGEKFSSDHVLNDPDSIRKLFCIKEMLENEVKEKQPKQDFSLPENVMSIISEHPTNISKIVESINELRGTHMKKLKIKDVTSVLIENELLYINEASKKAPTLKGEELGIYVEIRTGMNGTYPIILYSKEAQKEIIKLLMKEFNNNR